MASRPPSRATAPTGPGSPQDMPPAPGQHPLDPGTMPQPIRDELLAPDPAAIDTASKELRDGLNPKPPDLTREAGKREPAQRFWIVKHGLKMTGMPAWGRTHDDANLWSIVAFLERLPLLDTAGYRALLASSKAHGDHGHHDNEHRDGAEHEREHEVHDSHGDRGEDNATTRAPTSRSSS